MKTKYGKWPGASWFLHTLRFKSIPFVAMSLFATIKLTAQNQNPSSPPVAPNTVTPSSANSTPDNYHWDPFERHETVTSSPASSGQSLATPAGNGTTVPPTLLQAPKPTKNEVSVSSDVMFGQGTVTLPLGYSLQKSLGGIVQTPVTAVSVPRSSIYYGGTISYSYGQAWYVDLSYSQGHSSGNQTIGADWLGSLNSNFSIDDTWYQIYVKYTFPQLRGKRFSAYLRGGASYITADLNDTAAQGGYTQKDSTTDVLGNFGFGLGYSLYASGRLRFGLECEGEGFYGNRSQQSLEAFNTDFGLNPVTANINNTLYGGIGLATMRLEYRLGRSGLFKVFGEAGAEGRNTEISYPGAGTHNELLWGPYAKLGISYAF